VSPRKSLEIWYLRAVGQGEFAKLRELGVLCLVRRDGRVLVTHGRTLLNRLDGDDPAMRNLTIVALTDAGRRVDDVTRAFGLTAKHAWMPWGVARRGGSASLGRRPRRRPKLSDRQVARAWAGEGWTQQSIADRLGVAHR